MGSIRVNGDGTADWVGLTGDDLAAIVQACACARWALRRSSTVTHVESVAYEALGGCMAVWEHGEEVRASRSS